MDMAAQVNLVQNVHTLLNPVLMASPPLSDVPLSFWGALTCNETGIYIIHNLVVPSRFEPSIYAQLTAVAKGQASHFGSLTTNQLVHYNDVDIHNLSSSYGLTQIMGYESLSLNFPLPNLDIPETHFRIASLVMGQFLTHWGLNPTKDFDKMAHCWNSGRPGGATWDPNYTSNLLTRKSIWEAL